MFLSSPSLPNSPEQVNSLLLRGDPQIAGTYASASSLIMKSLVHGCCGRFERSRIPSCVDLLVGMLCVIPVSGIDAEIDIALNQDCFKLGASAVNLTKDVLRRVVQSSLDKPHLTEYLESIWELHQVDEPDALPESDSVFRFLRLYG